MSEHTLAILVKAVGAAQAAKDLKGVDKAVSGIGARAGKGLRTFGSSLKSAFSSPIGLLGIGGGMFALDKVLEDSIGKAQEFGAEISKMQAITGLDAQTTSALAAAMEHYGISAEDALKITGMLEKNIGNLTGTATNNASSLLKVTKAQQAVTLARMRLNELEHKGKASASSLTAARFRLVDAEKALTLAQSKSKAGASGAAKFYDKYHFSLTNANGTVKNANQLLLTSADYFNNKAIPAQTKAAAMAKLYGRSWQTLIPFLKAGSRGIGEAEAEAKRLGLTLTGDNIAALKKNRDATREWNTALGGLELQIGLKLIPYMTTLAQTATQFVSQHGSDITGFFDDAATFAGQLGGAIHDYVVPAFSAISDVWGKIPPDMKKLLIAGFAVNKLSGGALTGIVGDLGKGLIKGVLGMTAGVVNINAGVVNGGGGLPGGAAGGAAGGIGTLGKVALVGEAIGLAAIVEAVREHYGQQSTDQAAGLQSTLDVNIKNMNPAELQNALNGVNQGIHDIQSNPLLVLVQGDALKTLQQMQADLQAQLAAQTGRDAGSHDKLKTPKQIFGDLKKDGISLAAIAKHRSGISLAEIAKHRRDSLMSATRDAGSHDTFKQPKRIFKDLKLDHINLGSLAQHRLDGLQQAQDKTRAATRDMDKNLGGAISQTRSQVAQGARTTASATLSGASGTTGAVNVGASRTVAAINGAFSRIPAPVVIVNVTANSVTTKVTQQARNGTVGGSKSGAGGMAHRIQS